MDAPKREQDKLTSFLGENKDGSTVQQCFFVPFVVKLLNGTKEATLLL